MGRLASRLFAFIPLLATLALAAPALAQPAASQGRIAVVVGVESYPAAIGAEPGARADARHVAQALEAEGFAVELLEDPGEATLKRSVFGLVDRLNAAGEGAIGLFYFAGAGVQINGSTFLLPVDARTVDDLAVSASGLSAELVSERLSSARGAASLIVLDAASPNALTSRFSLRPGIAAFDAPDGGMVMFSHNPDQVVLGRQDGVSVFARAFAELVHDAADFEGALQAMRRSVGDQTGGSRYVWISGRVPSRFSLAAPPPPPAPAADTADDAPPPAPAASTATERTPPPPPAPTPVPAARDLVLAAPGGQGVTGDRIHVVEVFFGTDRAMTLRDGRPSFGGETGPALLYGIAEVSIPPAHAAGQLEAPRWWRFEFAPDEQKHVVYRGSSVRGEDDFFSELRDIVADSAEKQAFVFIHGFNTSFEDAARRTAQMHHDLNFDGAPIFYSWASEASSAPLAYARDGNAADRTVPRLQAFLMAVADRTGAEKIHLIAHSMGNRALVNALDEIAEQLVRDGRPAPFNQIVLSAPDIDRDVFLSVADQILPTARRVSLYASADDRALQISRDYNGAPRAGDSSQGIVIVDGVNTIDASGVRTELFDFGHDYYADENSILADIGLLMATDAEPGARGLEQRLRPPDADPYWVILRGMIGDP
jgi:esterase/lipase superfamily enzyme